MSRISKAVSSAFLLLLLWVHPADVARSRIAEDLLLALRDQLQSYSSNCGTFDASTIAKSETDARRELGACKERLTKLEALLGPEGNVEIRQLVEKVEEREGRLKVLEAQAKSQDHVRFVLSAFGRGGS